MRAYRVSIRILVSLLVLLPALPLLSGAEEVVPAGVSPSWLSEAKANIEKAEYHFSRQKDGFHSAPNRAHGLRTRVTEEGIEVESRMWGAAEGDGWQLTLRAVRFGRGAVREAVRPGMARFEEGRASLLREAFTEIYVNDPQGLEQVFDVPVPPRGNRDAGPLVIEMALGGNVLGNLSEDGALVVFGSPAGKPVAHLRDLLVTDANGNAVPARFRLAPGTLAIEIEDLDVVYPLHVDPLLTTPAWTEDSGQTGAGFAFSVSTAGDVDDDGFSDVLIGTVLYDNGQTDEGRVSLYKGSASGLPTVPNKNFEQNQAFANFGWSVSAAGDLEGDGFDDIIVGAPNWDGPASNGGAFWVYLGGSPLPDDIADNEREGGQAGEHLGVSVAWAGDVDRDFYDDVIVGAPDYDNGGTDAGKAFLYYGDPNDILQNFNHEELSGGQVGAKFGWAVSTAGDVNGDGYDDVIVGAQNWDNASTTDVGKVFAYYGSSSGIATTPSWEEEYFETGAHFGYSVSTAGDVNGDGYADIVIGAFQEDGTVANEGAILVYRGSATGLPAAANHVRRSGELSGELGWSVGTAGDVNGDGYADVVAGAPFIDAGGTDRGRAYVWCGSSSGIGANPCWQVDGTQNSSEFGRTVATAGDVNGDGFSDVLVGAWKFDNGSTDEGQAFLYLGSGDAPATTSARTLQASDTSIASDFGMSVASAGDVNGDGFSDLIVGDPLNSAADAGAAFVFLGTATGPSTVPATTLLNDQFHDAFGQSVAGAGDVNGDGYDDVIVGAPFWSTDTVEDDEDGRIYVFHGGPSGVDATADFQDSIYDFPVLDQNIGEFVAGVGDVNGDGYGDVMVGGRASDAQSYLYYGSPTGLLPFSADYFDGEEVYAAGDVNGDGFADVVTVHTTPLNFEEARIYFGGSPEMDESSDWSRSAEFECRAAPTGDVNGDGYGDIFLHTFGPSGVTNSLFLGGPTGPGAVANQTLSFSGPIAPAGDLNGDGRADILVRPSLETLNAFFGSSTGLSTTAGWTVTSPAPGDDFATSFTSAGDVNGDGFSDVLVGAPDGLTGGNARLYYGGGGDGLDRLPRQRRVGTSVPISLLGNADLGDQFKLKLIRRHPGGRDTVGIKYETAQLGQVFGTGPSGLTTMSDSGVPGTGGSGTDTEKLVTGLVPQKLYRWRARLYSNNPFFRGSKWFAVPGNNVTESDFRTPCTATTWFRDIDLDNFGNSAVTLSACTQPSGYVAIGGDCNDSDDDMFPGNPEVCDGKDNNCAGGIDDGFLAPTLRPSEVASRSGATITLTWPAVPGADRYDVVKGGIQKLQSTKGDFTSTTACVSDSNGHTLASDSTAASAGDGFWYLVRAVNCNAAGSYDDGTEVRPRDAEIAASGHACP